MVSDPFDLGTDDVNENTTSHAPEPPPPNHADNMSSGGETMSLSQRAAARMPLDAGNGELAKSMEDLLSLIHI